MIARRDFLATATLLVAGGATWADDARTVGPEEILLIRHAEKPTAAHDIHLNPRGRARADALIRLFPARFQPPTFLFAARQSKLSNRAVETLQPLARSLKLSIDDRFADAEYSQLVTALRQRAYNEARVLICWHHESIPALARALGATRAPAKWSDDVFDRIWRLRSDASTLTFTELNQDLLPGDARARAS